MTIRPFFFLALTASMIIVSCARETAPGQVSKADLPEAETEKLLEAEGSWSLVEEDKTATPTQQHMEARGQVNPKQTGKKRPYTSTPSETEMSENVHFRVLRLESEMEGLKSDFGKLLPPLTGLMVADRNLDMAVADVHARRTEADAAQEKPEQPANLAAPPSVPRPADGESAQSEKPQAAPSAPAPLPGGAPVITGLRFGEHPGKTRIVLDSTAPVNFTYNVDNGEHVLVVDLPGTGWTADMQKAMAKHPLIKGYSAQPSAAGTTLALELVKDAKVVMSSLMKPNDVYGHHRVVLDLASL